MFCGESRRCFEDVVAKHRLTLVLVDVKEDLLRQSTYQHLLVQAIRGRIKALIGGPPCRTNSIRRYFPLPDGSAGPRPVRDRGDSLCAMDHESLSGSEVAMRRIDDLLHLRFLTLFCVACECSRLCDLPDPGFAVEQSEDPEDWVGKRKNQECQHDLMKLRPSKGFASFWCSPEWQSVRDAYQLHRVSFDQGPLLHSKCKPTTLGTNLRPAAELVGCRGPGVESWINRSPAIKVSKTWAAWSPGLKSALGYMLQDWLAEENAVACRKIRKIDASFVEHIKLQHIPYRRDCRYCVQGGARQRPHRRILTPQAWTLSVDTTGPFVRAQDENLKTRYLVIGILTVPKLIAAPPKEEAEGEKPPAEADEALEVPDEAAEALEAGEWLADGDADS